MYQIKFKLDYYILMILIQKIILKVQQVIKKVYQKDSSRRSLVGSLRQMMGKSEQKKIELDQNIRNSFQNIIINIHGGAFIASSSSYHQTYLRKFCNTLKIPIFAIDYRLAPTQKFPIGLHDTFSAFMWILNFVKTIINIDIKNYIIFGDSSGGNFSTCLTQWIIESNLRQPSLLALSYPCMKLRKRDFTPSFLKTLTEKLMSYKSAEIILDFYLEDNSIYQSDCYLNMLNINAAVLKRFPKTRIYVGDLDPLYDDCVRFLQLLVKAKIDCNLYSFLHLPHGLLSHACGDWYSALIFFQTICNDFYYAFNLKGEFQFNNKDKQIIQTQQKLQENEQDFYINKKISNNQQKIIYKFYLVFFICKFLISLQISSKLCQFLLKDIY